MYGIYKYGLSTLHLRKWHSTPSTGDTTEQTQAAFTSFNMLFIPLYEKKYALITSYSVVAKMLTAEPSDASLMINSKGMVRTSDFSPSCVD